MDAKGKHITDMLDKLKADMPLIPKADHRCSLAAPAGSVACWKAGGPCERREDRDLYDHHYGAERGRRQDPQPHAAYHRPADFDRWLGAAEPPADLLRSYSPDEMEAYPVSKDAVHRSTIRGHDFLEWVKCCVLPPG
jgi:hypothetical protein